MTTPTRQDNAERNWRDRCYRSPLISHQWISWAIGIAFAILVAIWCQEPFQRSYTELRSTIPAAMIAVAGFVIAAMTILISTPSKTNVGGAIAEKNPQVWDDLVKRASGAAKIAGGVALLVIVEPFLRTLLTRFLEEPTVDTVWTILFVMVTTVSVIAALRVIWLLERVSARVQPASKG